MKINWQKFIRNIRKIQDTKKLFSMITKHTIAEKMYRYLNHDITLAQLVDWCEQVMNDGDIAEADTDVVAEVAARVGLADVKNFGLLWEDFEEMLKKLGYQLNFDLQKVA